jgi:hypothetical protein
MPRLTTFERFQRNCVQDPSGCTLWIGRISVGGYGRFSHKRSSWTPAHRWLWERINGPVPNDHCIMHTCDVRNCVNPLHLMLGTHKLNMRDMAEKGRAARGARHHKAKLTEDQVRVIIHALSTGERICDVANAFNVTRFNITQISIGKAWKHLPRPSMRNRHRGNCKLSDKQVEKIRDSLGLGVSGAYLARQYGVSDATISNLRRNKHYSVT